MNKNLHSEMTNLDILKKIHYRVFGIPKKEEKTKGKSEFTMLSEDYLKYVKYAK